jgi:hypothetical protein
VGVDGQISLRTGLTSRVTGDQWPETTAPDVAWRFDIWRPTSPPWSMLKVDRFRLEKTLHGVTLEVGVRGRLVPSRQPLWHIDGTAPKKISQAR